MLLLGKVVLKVLFCFVCSILKGGGSERWYCLLWVSWTIWVWWNVRQQKLLHDFSFFVCITLLISHCNWILPLIPSATAINLNIIDAILNLNSKLAIKVTIKSSMKFARDSKSLLFTFIFCCCSAHKINHFYFAHLITLATLNVNLKIHRKNRLFYYFFFVFFIFYFKETQKKLNVLSCERNKKIIKFDKVDLAPLGTPVESSCFFLFLFFNSIWMSKAFNFYMF